MFDESLLSEVYRHAENQYPHECCGFIISNSKRLSYFPTPNISRNPQTDFEIPISAYVTAEASGEIIALVHSHCDAAPNPSDMDLAVCNNNRKPSLIVSWPGKEHRIVLPDAEMPLVGRPFVHGVWDCYACIRDYYKTVLNIELPDFERVDGWWESLDGPELYLDNFKKAGFVEVDDDIIKQHDVILMQVSAPKVNHAGIMTERNMMLHHLYGYPCKTTMYGGYWRDRTRLVIRHEGLL